jgi:3-oxoacyl-[acyl-carrier-protein] synthase-3
MSFTVEQGQQQRTPAPGAARAAAIHGLGAALPEHEVANDDLGLVVSDDWILSRTGIRSRRYMPVDQPLSALAAAAGAAALEEAGAVAADVDLVLVTTSSPDQAVPNTASRVALQLGIPAAAGAIDLGMACGGWVAGLGLAAAAVESRRAERVLLVAAERMSTWIHAQPQKTGALFADGAAAALIGPAGETGRIGPVLLGNDAAAGSTIDVFEGPDGTVLWMDGQEVFERAVRDLVHGLRAALDASGLGLADIDVFAFHQANARITRAVAQRLGLEGDPRVVEIIEWVGNTSSASVPLVLAEAQRRGLLVPGANAALCAVGGGMTWAAGIVEWGRP